MTIFVTGGGGFLGQAIVRQLISRGDSVVSYSRRAYPELEALGAQHRQGDLSDAKQLMAAMKNCEAVIHVAALAGIWGKPADFHQANVIGTENVLSAMQALEIPKLVYTSSPSVVHPGDAGVEGRDESLPYPNHYLADYPRTKAIAERMVLAANSSKLSTVSLRPHLIWGPGDPHFVHRLVARAQAGRLRLIGNDDPLVDTVFVENAAEAHLLALDRLRPGSACAGKAYFITQGEPVTISRFMNGILAAAGVPPVTRRIPKGLAVLLGGSLEAVFKGLNLKGEPPMTRFLAHQLATPHWFDISAARRDLDYTPRISFDQGLELLAESLQKQAPKTLTKPGSKQA